MKPFKLSAKELGELALPTFCSRCFWIKRHVKNLPYQIFPGIFSSIDSYSKRITSHYFEHHQSLAKWFIREGIFGNPIKIPHHTIFQVLNNDTGILLSGAPDEMIHLHEGGYSIIDYKTAKLTENQDALLPLYEVQLNAYAYIAENLNYKPIKSLFLVYYDPITDIPKGQIDAIVSDEGFSLPFLGKFVQITKRPDNIILLLKKARQLYDSQHPPEGRADCKDCQAINSIIKILS